MDWIKECWSKNHNPSFKEFASYWRAEYQRREAGGTYSSAMINRRVVFFREHAGKSKAELEKLWKKVRTQKAKEVITLLKSS